jgi:hypothetical protein
MVLQPLNPVQDLIEATIDKPGLASRLGSTTSVPVMPRNGNDLSLNLHNDLTNANHPQKRIRQETNTPALVWDWDVEHEDRRRERKADTTLRGAAPFEVDRRVLKDVVREKMGVEVGRIKFLSAGMFQPGSRLIHRGNH